MHVDPGAGWFPHYLGFADETGRGAGEGANLNLPLPEGTGDQGWLAAIGTAIEAVVPVRPERVVLSLGVDAAADDPESPLRVTEDGYRSAAQQVGRPRRPGRRRPGGRVPPADSRDGSWLRPWTVLPTMWPRPAGLHRYPPFQSPGCHAHRSEDRQGDRQLLFGDGVVVQQVP